MSKDPNPRSTRPYRFSNRLGDVWDRAKRSVSPIAPASTVNDDEASAFTSGYWLSRDASPPTSPVMRIISIEPDGNRYTANPPRLGSRDSNINRGGGITPPNHWEKALAELTDKQRRVLKAFGIANTKSFEAEIQTLQSMKYSCTNNLTPEKIDKRPIMTRARIHNILKKMEKYAVIGDIAIQHNPAVVALVWAAIRFCLQVALNDMQTFEAVSSALDDIASVMASCRIYEKIYSMNLESIKAVMEQLPRLYAHCLRFMAEAINYYQTDTAVRVTGGVTNPFETRFKPLIEEINNGKRELERRCAVASHELQGKMSESQKEEFGKLNDQLADLRIDIERVSTGVEGIQAVVSGEKRRNILNWLSKVNYSAHHEKARQLRFDGTGQWLFGKPAFQLWIETETSSAMWLYGKAGSGKTILSSLVIDTLTATYKLVPTIYFYCNYGESERRDTLSIIGTLLKQLLTSRRCDNLDPEMVTTFDDGICLNPTTSEALLAATLSQFEKVFVVVDALDECSEEERKSVVMLFVRLMNAKCQLKVFVTGRPERDLRKMLENNPCHQIDANDTSKDITPFVAAALDKHIISRALLGGNVSPALKKELVDTISVQADGMFLWAKLQLDYICKQGNEEEVRAQLTKLPRGLDRTYDRIWERINDTDDTERKWALKTLMWVLRTKEPLKPEEILEATALEPFDTAFDKNRMTSSLEYLVQVCGHFIALDVATNRLRFVHYSVQEFLGKKAEFHSAEDHVAEVCLTILSHEVKISRSGWNYYQEPAGSSRYLCEYATRNWASHCKPWEAIDDRRGSLLRQFLFNKICLNNWASEKYIGASPYEVASYFNLPVILEYLLQQGLHDDDLAVSQSRALIIAVSRDYTAVVKVLLKGGTDTNTLSFTRLSTNYWSRYSGEVGVPQFALEVATKVGNEEIVELLLGAGANADGHGRIALKEAARGGHQKIVELLLNAGANANAKDKSAYRGAAWRGDLKILELLLNARTDINTHDPSALRAAARGGHQKIVEVLLNAGADANAENGIALGEAIMCGHHKIVELLRNAGADINAQGQFALATAASRGHAECVRLLLDTGINANAQGGSALRGAAGAGHQSVVEMLLNAGADANAENGAAYRIADWAGHKKIAELLLNAITGVDSAAESATQTETWLRRLKAVQQQFNDSIDANALCAAIPRPAVELPVESWTFPTWEGIEDKYDPQTAAWLRRLRAADVTINAAIRANASIPKPPVELPASERIPGIWN